MNTAGLRCGWGMSVQKTGNEFQLVIMYKDSRNIISRYSKSHRGSAVKVPWGPPDICSAGSEFKDNSSHLYLRCIKGQKKVLIERILRTCKIKLGMFWICLG